MTFSSQNPSSLQSLILNKIKQQNISHDQIIQSMGYHPQLKTQSKALKRLQEVLSSADLGLTRTRYDFKYASAEFVHTLCQVLEINAEDYLPLLEQIEQHAHKVLHATTPIVYADIAFNDDFRPSFMSVMAVSKFTHIRVDNEMRLLDTDSQLQAIHALIQQHYLTMTGTIPFAGMIKGYQVSFDDEAGQRQRLYIPADFT